MKKYVLAAIISMLVIPAFAADWNAPAEYSVSGIVVKEDPGAWTATIGEGPINNWFTGGAFEPMALRMKWHTQGGSPNEIVVDRSRIDGFNSYRDGVFDGAAVRVYRIENGAFVKVREDTIANHYASDWIRPERLDDENELISPATPSAEVSFASWYRMDADYHFKVVAVDDQGNESLDSDIATLHWNGWSGGQQEMTNTLVSFTAPGTPSETNAPAAPANFLGAYDSVSGLMTFSWDAVGDPDLAGYRLYYCDRAPASLNGYHLYLTDTPVDTNLHLRTGDMVFMEKQMTTWDKDVYLANRVYSTSQYGQLPGLVPYHNDAGKTWALVPHPGTPPALLQTNAGQTCLQLDLSTGGTIQMAQYNHSHTQQSFYKVLDTNKTYVAEVWLRQSGMSSPTATFGFDGFYNGKIAPANFVVTTNWQQFTTTFTPPALYVGPGGTGRMKLEVNGPGTLWVDNFRVYEQGTDFMDFTQLDYDALADSGLHYLRTHSHIKSGFGHTMDMLTNPRGVMGSRGWLYSHSQHTLASLLDIMRNAGIKPWLQIEMYMTEAEWLGWVEYMAAPYNPGTDTPASKPWAYKRYEQGQTAPWTDVFDSLLFEISNETWNPLFNPWTFNWQSMTDTVTATTYQSGDLYGLWQEYVIALLRSSPYWTQAVEDKFEFVIGGWATERGTTGYGQQAAVHSSNSLHMTVAGYNGGWDEGEPPATADDPTRFKTLTFAVQAAEPHARELADTLLAQQASGEADYLLGTYEAGPGYNLNGLNGVTMTPEQVEAESQVMKSLAGGTATLDSFLMRTRYGYDLQNFFTFDRNRHYWTSHARWEYGHQAYPCWSSLSLYNLYAAGDHLLVQQDSSPTWDLPQTVQRDPVDDAPMTAVYATRGGDRYGVFCLSRKMDDYPVAGDDGYTPMTVNLPFILGTNSSIALHKLTGDTRAHNLDTNNVDIVSMAIPTNQFAQSFVLNAARGADDRGLPPASAFLYVFDNVEAPVIGTNAAVSIRLADGVQTPTLQLPVEFNVVFDQPIDPASFTAGDVQFTGTATIDGVEVEPVPYTADAVFIIRVTGAATVGTIIPSLPAGVVDTAAGGVNEASSYEGTVFELGIPPGGGTYTFTATDDTRLSGADGINYGDDTMLSTLASYGVTWGDRTFLKFPTLPDLAGRQPGSAEVRLFYYARGAGAPALDNHLLLAYPDNWSEDTLSLTLAEAYALHGDNEVSPPVSVTNMNAWYAFDCIGYAITELAGDRTFSFAFDQATAGASTTYLRWYSKEYLDGVYAPELVLTFNDPTSSPPFAPTALSATAQGDNAIDLTWTDNSAYEDGFIIERRTNGGAFAAVATLSSNVTSHTDTGLDAATEYTYRVKAFNTYGDSPFVGTATATTGSGSLPSLLVYEGFDTTVAIGSAINTDPAWADTDHDGNHGIVRDGLTFSNYVTSGKAVATTSTETDYRSVSLDDFEGYGTLYLSGMFKASAPASWGGSALTSFSLNSGNTSGRLVIGLTNGDVTDNAGGHDQIHAYAGSANGINEVTVQSDLAVATNNLTADTTCFVLARLQITDDVADTMDISLMVIEDGNAIPATEPAGWDAVYTGASYANWAIESPVDTLDKLNVEQGNTPGTAGVSNLSDEFRAARTYAGALPDSVSGSDPYGTWLAFYDLTGDDALLETDIEPDGLVNLMEYALDGNPTNDDKAAVLPDAFVADDSGSNYLYHVHNERTNDPDLAYRVGTKTNLVVEPSWDTNGVSFVNESAVVGDFKSVTNRAGTSEPVKFIGLEIEK